MSDQNTSATIKGTHSARCGLRLLLLSLLAAPLLSTAAVPQWANEIFGPALVYQSTVTSQFYKSALAACDASRPAQYTSGNVVITHFGGLPGNTNSCTYGVTWYDPSTNITTSDTVRYQNMYEQRGACPPDAVGINGKCHITRTAPNDESQCVGNPLRAGNGDKVQHELDYLTADSGLRFERQFASRHIVARSGALGANWFIRIYERSLQFVSVGSTPHILATRELGRVRQFWQSNGYWVSDPNVHDRVEALASNFAPAAWKYIDGYSDESEFYDASGRLLYIQNRAGLTTTLSYSDAATPSSTAPGPGYLIAINDAFGRSVQLFYSAEGLLIRMRDPAGQDYHYAFDEDASEEWLPSGRLTSVTYPDTKRRTYHYESEHLPAATAALGPSSFPNIINLTANSAGTANYAQVLIGERALRGLTGITDENSQRYATFRYDDKGRAVGSEHAGGVEAISLAPGTGAASTATDAFGVVRTYTFQTSQGIRRTLSVSEPCTSCGGSVAAATTYDSNGNVASKKDFNGNLMCFTNDLSRNLETKRVEGLTGAACPGTGVAGITRTISTEWHATWRLPKRIAEPKRITSYVYNGDAGVICGATAALCSKTITETADATGALGFSAAGTTNTRTWTYTYNSNGQVLSVNGPRTDVSDITTYAYYSANDPNGNFRIGDLASVTNALGHVTQITHYDAHGKPKRIVDPNGLVTQLDYWPRGWLKSRNVGGLITLFDYDGVGQLKKVTNPDGSFVSYTYDAAHRLTDITDTSGNTLHYTLDLMSNVTKEELKNSLGVVIATKNRQFDALSRLQKELNAANAEVANFGYDANGNLKTVTQKVDGAAANDELSSYDYDPRNRLKKITDALAGVAEYGYSGLDQLTLVKDPRALTTTYAVDGLDNVTSQASPDTGTTINTFDAAGNIKSMKDANNTTVTYTYDALNRLTQKAVGTTVINYTYDSVVSGNFGKGRLTGMVDATGTTAYTYDLFGRVTKKTHTPASGLGSNARTVQYGYDAYGRLGSITYPSGRVVNYAYTNGRVSAITVGATQTVINNIAYFGFHTPASWTQGSGKTYSRTFDADGRIASYTNNTSQIAVTYDLADNIKLLTDPATAANTKSFTYDKLDRLTGYGSNGGATSQGFAYDAVGNRQSTLVNGASTIYTSATTSNRLASVGANTYGYNAAGNQTSAASRTYAYDVFGRMSSATVSGVATPYRYNGLGQRLYKGGANLARFVYDEQGQLIGEYNNTGTMLREIVWLQDIPVAVMTPSGTATNLFYIDSDHLNTPRTITNQAKQKRWEWNSDPFGSTLANENPAALGVFTFNLRFPGQYFDKETGLHYNYFRDYNPQIGRYIQSDPIGLEGGLNTYGYVDSQPLFFADPTGLAGEVPVREIAPRFVVDIGGEHMGGGASAPRTTNNVGPKPKPVNLPGARKITVNMPHVKSGHMMGGSRLMPGSRKDVFPSRMTESQVERAIKQAYETCSRIETQDHRIKVRGTSEDGLTIDMWVNTQTKQIETAWPVSP